MVRTTVAAIAAVVALGLIGAPAAQARPCYGNGTTCSHDPSYRPGPQERKDAAHRVADPIAKRITDAIRKHQERASERRAKLRAHFK